EVRGDRRPRRRLLDVAVVDARTVRFAYHSLDAVKRTTTIHFDPAPESLTEDYARWTMDLDAVERFNIVVKTVCAIDVSAAEPPHMLSAYRKVRTQRKARVHRRAGISSGNELFNTVIDRAASDIDMLLTVTN